MTKAERIRNLAEKHPEWSPKQIAAQCDCGDSYVRVVLRQRTLPGGRSKSDLSYAARILAEHGKCPSAFFVTRRRHADHEYRERKNAYFRDWRARKKAERQVSAPA